MLLEERVPLKSFTTFHIGGPARFFISVRSTEEIFEAVREAKKRQLPFFILGGGSNVLVPDEGFNGLVIKMEYKGITFEEKGMQVEAMVGAGENWDEFVAKVVARGLWGLENLSGIPGTVGGTPIQNVGAYGAEVADCISWVEAFDSKKEELRTFTNSECRFAYRDSFFKSPEGKHFIVTRVCYSLSTQPAPNLSYRDLERYFFRKEVTLPEIREAVLGIRKSKFPDISQMGTAGSFFKNPIVAAEVFKEMDAGMPGIPHFALPDGRIKVSLGYILEKLGWKGIRKGNAGVFERQALVLINLGNASSGEIRELATQIMDDVYKKIGVQITPEIIFVE